MNFDREHIKRKYESVKVNEMELDAFEQDAIEGWKELSPNDLIRLEKRYSKRISFMKICLSALFFTSFVLSIFFYEFNRSNQEMISLKNNPTNKHTTKTPELTPIKLPKQSLTLIAQKNQVQPAKIREDLKRKRIKEEIPSIIQESHNRQEIFEIKPMPSKRIAPVLIQNRAYEIYIQDLLVVDYRHYRKRDPIVISNDLTGTPANQTEKKVEYHTKTELDVSYVNFLSKTLALFNRKQFQEAVGNFEIILSKYPDDINALFYESISLYNLGLTKDAIHRLKQLEMSVFTNFNEEQQWYLLLCYKEDKNKELFLELRTNIISSKGFYWMRAKQLEFE